MKPTARLRFVERVVPTGEGVGQRLRILQQWWEDARRINLGFGEVDIAEPTGEWRDVQLENEA